MRIEGAKPGPKGEKLPSVSMGKKGSNTISWVWRSNQTLFNQPY